MASPTCQAQVEATPAGTQAGGTWPLLHHRNAPVPSVSLASPSVQHRWPNRAACWSPTIALITARPPQTAASVTAIWPAVGAMAGSIWPGIANRSSIAWSHAPAASSKSMVRHAIDGSVTCTAPPLSCQVSQQATSPKSSLPLAAARRAPGTSSSSQRSFDALNAGSSGRPVRARTRAS